MSKLILGEGKEEVRFFSVLAKHIGLSGFQVEDYGGKNKLTQYLAALVVRSGFEQLESLILFRDADDNPSGAFVSVAESLTRCGLLAPSNHGQIGAGRPRVGVYVLPDGLRKGMLEDLCIESVKTDKAMLCVDEFIACVNKKCQYLPKPESKARAHAWLASRKTPDKRLGEAAEAGYWPWESDVFLPLIRFLERFR